MRLNSFLKLNLCIYSVFTKQLPYISYDDIIFNKYTYDKPMWLDLGGRVENFKFVAENLCGFAV